MIVWWVTEAIPIPMTALLGVTLCALLEATPPPPEGDSSVDVVFSLFTDDTIFLFIGSFIIAQAMVVHGLHRRLAYRVLRSTGGRLHLPDHPRLRADRGDHFAGHVEYRGRGDDAPDRAGRDGRRRRHGGPPGGRRQGPERLRFGAALMLVITYSITVGGLLLPIGSPPNLIGRELLEEETGEPITFLEWFVMALPIVIVMFVAVVLIVTTA